MMYNYLKVIRLCNNYNHRYSAQNPLLETAPFILVMYNTGYNASMIVSS